MEENKQNPAYEERDATLDEEPAPAKSADELQESILEDSGMTPFQKYCARMDDRRWARAQRLAGALLGAVAGVALFWDSFGKSESAQQNSFFSLPVIIAIVVALFVPNFLEKKCSRSIPKLRIAMIFALAAVIAVYILIIGLRTGFQFTS